MAHRFPTRRTAGLLAGLLAGVLATAALPAQDSLLRRPFDRFDKNKDGFIQADEYPGNPALFAAMDKNRDKRVDFEEYKASPLARRYLAAMRANRSEPRERKSLTDLAAGRLEIIARFDKNKDGKITKAEWTGAPDAFRSLDVDGNGVIDKKDRAQATAEDEVLRTALNTLPVVRSKLPGTDQILGLYDKDKDQQLNEKEVERTPLKPLFRYADGNGDGQLDNAEITRLVQQVNARIDQRDQGYTRARAPQIPFKTWDKNKDGRIDLKEWVDRKHLFKAMDLNRDAGVTEEEVLRYKRAFEGSNFIEKFDLNGDNRVTREEFAGTRAAFDRADRNRDGVISSRDR